MKRYTVLLFLLIPLSISFGQEVFLGMQSGMGWYKMEELSSFNARVARANPLYVRLVDDYPPYLYYQPCLSVNWERIEVGICYSFHSTGSRYSLKDYSGESLSDTRVSSRGPGALLNIRVIQLSNFRLLLYNEIGYLKTRLEMEESLYLGDEEVFDETYRFSSSDFYWEPGVKVEYPLASFLFEFNLGYARQFAGEGLYSLEDNYSGYLEVYGSQVHAGWSGLRLGLTAAMNLTRMNKGGKDQ